MKTILGYTAGILALLIAGYIVLTALNRPTGQLLDFILLLLGQASGTVAILVKQMMTDNQVAAVNDKVNKVAEQTNGHLTTLIDAAIHSTPTPATDKTEGESNNAV